MKAESARARGVDRVLEILDCLHRSQQPLRIGELARRLKAPRSTLYELIARLTAAGLIESYDEDGRIYFGRAMHFYAADYLKANTPSRRARDEVIRLAERSGETAQYCILHGDKYTILHMQPGRKVFRITSEIGVLVPLPWTASGRLLLNHLTRDEIDRFIPADDFILPSGERIGPDAFHDDIARSRHDGYCITTGLVDDITECIAAPVKSESITIACVCFVIAERKSAEEEAQLIEALRASAQRLSSGLDVLNAQPLGKNG